MSSTLFGFNSRMAAPLAAGLTFLLGATLCAVPAQAAPESPTTTDAAEEDDPGALPDPLDVSEDAEELKAPDAFAALATAVSSGKRVEDTSAATETSRTFVNPDGTRTLDEYSDAIQAQTEDGQWEDIDLTLISNLDGTWSPKNSAAEVIIGGSQIVDVALNDDGDQRAALTWPQQLPAPTIDGPTATFAVSDTQDLVVTATSTGATYHLRLNEAPKNNVEDFDFTIKTTNASLREDNNVLSLKDADGSDIAQPVPVVAWDASTDQAGDPDNVVPLSASVSVESANTKTGVETSTLTLAPPADFLNDHTTQYPVIIDPVIGRLTGGGDTWIRSDLTAHQGTAYNLVVGKTEPSHTGNAYSFIRWDMDSKLTGTTIINATLNLYQYDSGTCATTAVTNVHALGGPFNTVTTNWANRPGLASIPSTTSFSTNRGRNNCASGLGNGFVTANITNMVRNWVNGTVTNYGLRLNAPGDYANNVSHGKRFCSRNPVAGGQTCNSAVRSPHVSVTYSTPPKTPERPKFTSTGITGTSNAAKVAFTTTGKDALGDKVKYKIEVRKASGTTVASCTTALVGSGKEATCSISGLTSGTTYDVHAQTINQHGLTSGWSTARSLTYDRVKPEAPSVTASHYSDGDWKEIKPASNTITITSNAPDFRHFMVKKNSGIFEPVKTAGTTKTASFAFNESGGNVLHVKTVDTAGNESAIKTFTFGSGDAHIVSPTSTGAKTINTFDVVAQAPAGPNANATATLMWRLRGTPEHSSYSPTLGTDAQWNTADTDVDVDTVGAVTTATATFDAATIASNPALVGVDRSRRHTVFDVQICFTYGQALTRCSWIDDPASHATVTYVPHAFGSDFPVADAGPGQVALWTGEFNTSTTDVSVPGYLGELTISRSLSSFNNTHDGPFGKGWKASFDGTDAGVAGYEVVDDTAFDGTIALVDEEENAAIFTQGPTKTAQKVGSYAPIDDETAQLGLSLAIKTDGSGKKLILTEDDGTITTWIHHGSGEWAPYSVMVDGDPSATRFEYDTNQNLTRIIAPHPTEVTCDNGSEQPGCRVLTLDYVKIANKDRVEQVTYTAYASDAEPRKTTVVATYAYDTDANLISVTDPRTGLSTSYTYENASIDNVTRLKTVTSAGLAPFTLNYKNGTVSQPFTDGVLSVQRGSTYTDAFAYDLAIGSLSTPDLNAQTIAAWGQTDTPTHMFAHIGQNGATQAVTGFTADLLRKSSLTYTNDDGRTLNTASYTNTDGGHWLLTSVTYDATGNIVRELDETGIYQILEEIAAGNDVNPDHYATITRYNPDILATVALQGHSTDPNEPDIKIGDTLTAAGTLVTDTWEPVREIVGDDGTITLGRQHTTTTYDQGAPNNGINPTTMLPFRLPTTTTVSLSQPDAASTDPTAELPTGEPVLTEQRSGYDPIDQSSPTGQTSGWIIGSPTTQTTENGDTDITTQTVYDTQGRAIKEIGPDSTGSDAATTLTHYYAPHADTSVPAVCRSTPQWAGLLCQITTGETVPTIPVETVTKYSYYLAAAQTSETLGSTTRTTDTWFDEAGRVTKSSLTVEGLSGSTQLPATRNIYDPATGLQTATQTLNPDGSVKAAVTTAYDSWGRATAYTDEHGRTSTTTYNAIGQVASETSSTGVTTSYTYDPYTSDVTSQDISGVGTFTATYDALGRMTSQTLPTGVTQHTTYDRTGQETSLSYTVAGNDTDAQFEWTMAHDELGRIFQSNGPAPDGGSRTSTYTFDHAARMTSATDTIGDTTTTRTYGFDTVGRRTSLATTTEVASSTPTTTSKTWNYDKADRILHGANNTGTYVYDPLGRQTSLPAIDTPQGIDAGNLTIGYYDNDLARTVTQNGVTTTYDLDVMERRSTSTTVEGQNTSTTTRVYEDTTDNPAWATTTTGNTTETTRYLSSIGGDLSLTLNVDTGFISTGIVDPQGSVVATTSQHQDENDLEENTPTPPTTVWSALQQFDEYGNTLDTAITAATGALTYAWLGGKERATDTTSLVLMGARLYNSVTGHFTSVDPVKGGNTTRYTYPQDPINQEDLDGLWKKKAGRALTHAAIGLGVGVLAVAACVGTAGAGCVVAATIAIGMPAHMLGGLAYDKATKTKVTGQSLLKDMAKPVTKGFKAGNKMKKSTSKAKRAGTLAKPKPKTLIKKSSGKHAKKFSLRRV